MKVFEMEGRTVDEATKKAAGELNIDDISKVRVEVIDPGKSGIFGFGVSRPAKVRIYYSDDSVDIGEITKEILLTILGKMGIDGKVKDIKEALAGYPLTKPENLRLAMVAEISSELERLQADYLQLQREIERVKEETELQILRVQADFARREGRLEQAAEIEAALAEMTAPRSAAPAAGAARQSSAASAAGAQR